MVEIMMLYSETPESVASESVVTSVNVAKVAGQNPSIHIMTNLNGP